MAGKKQKIAEGLKDHRLVGQELGMNGLSVDNGVITEDSYRELAWPECIRTFDVMWYDPAIGAANNTIKSYIRKALYDVVVDEPNPSAEQTAQIKFVKECMDDMSESFNDMVNSASSKLKYGFSVHEKVFKYRNSSGKYKSKFNDGRIGWAKLPIRSQRTISKWFFDELGRELKGVEQDLGMVNTGYDTTHYGREGFIRPQKIELPRKRFMHFRHDPENNNPEGTSPLKGCWKPWKYKEQVEMFQAAGISRDLGGLPVMTMPPEYMADDAPEDKKALYLQYQNIIRNIQANEQAGLILPAYYDPDTKQPLFTFELKTVTGGKLYDTKGIIDGYENKILMTYLADVLKLGQDATGSFALSDNKTNLLAVGIKSIVDEILQVFNNDLIPQTLVMNGWKVSNDMPRIVMEDLDDRDLDVLGQFVQRVYSTGAMEMDQAGSDFLRDACGLPVVDRSKPLDEKLLTPASSKAGEGMKTGGTGTSKGTAQNSGTNVSNKS